MPHHIIREETTLGDFSVNTKVQDNYAVIYTNGYINDLGGELIDKECTKILQKDISNIIINFAGSEFINSIGISILIGIIEKVSDINGRIIFTNLSRSNKDVFEMLGLTKFASIFSTETEAMKYISHTSGSQ